MTKRSTIGEHPLKRSNPLDKIIPGGVPKHATLPPDTQKQGKKPVTRVKIHRKLLAQANEVVDSQPNQSLDTLVNDALAAHLKKLRKKNNK